MTTESKPLGTETVDTFEVEMADARIRVRRTTIRHAPPPLPIPKKDGSPASEWMAQMAPMLEAVSGREARPLLRTHYDVSIRDGGGGEQTLVISGEVLEAFLGTIAALKAKDQLAQYGGGGCPPFPRLG